MPSDTKGSRPPSQQNGKGAESSETRAHMPSEATGEPGFFDRFAGAASRIVSRAPFFAFCLLLVFSWLTQGLVTVLAKGSVQAFLSDKYQLEINTTTTIITFLLVALLQNSQTRADEATQDKLNAVADALADLMTCIADEHDNDDLRQDIDELRAAVGVEERETTSDRSKGSGSGRRGSRDEVDLRGAGARR